MKGCCNAAAPATLRHACSRAPFAATILSHSPAAATIAVWRTREATSALPLGPRAAASAHGAWAPAQQPRPSLLACTAACHRPSHDNRPCTSHTSSAAPHETPCRAGGASVTAQSPRRAAVLPVCRMGAAQRALVQPRYSNTLRATAAQRNSPRGDARRPYDSPALQLVPLCQGRPSRTSPLNLS